MTLLQLANHYERTGQTARLLKLAKYSEKLLLYYLNQVPVIFAFRLADTEENRQRGRVGQNSGFRQGVRNPNYIPAEVQAKSKGRSTRYYDMGRQAWRSWRPGNVISVTAFWSDAEQRFVDTPEQAGITAGKEFQARPRVDPVKNPARAERTAKRDARKRERETLRNANRLRARR